MLETIKAEELVDKGTTYLPDIPGLSAEQMKYKFEEIVRDVVIPKFNAAIEELNAQFFVNPDGVDYLTAANIISSADGIKSATNNKAIPSAPAVKELTNAISAKVDKKYVVYRANGGKGTMAQKEYTSGMALTSNAYTRTGHTFKGWSTSEDDTVDYNDGSILSSFVPSFGSNVMELFAVWEEN